MFWLSALPLHGSAEDTWRSLQSATQRYEYSENYAFRLPNSFKIGTLDSLLGLSDDLVKVNTAVEATVNKIRRQLYDVQEDDTDDVVTVEGVKPEKYLQNFTWDEAKYPSRRPPKDTVAAIMETVQKLDEDLKLKSTEFSQMKTQLHSLLRKAQGSLAARDVSNIIPDTLLVSTENLKSMVCIVPKASTDDWLSNYETMTEYVVPRSSHAVEEDADYIAFAFVLFRRVADEFKTAARARGFQVKDVSGTMVAQEGEEEQAAIASTRSDTVASIQRLESDLEKKRDALYRWCLVSYAESFSSWIHVTAIRLFVESILRYGLPPQFLPVLIKPNVKHESELRKILSSRFSTVGGEYFTGGPGEDLFPFVSFNLAIEE